MFAISLLFSQLVCHVIISPETPLLCFFFFFHFVFLRCSVDFFNKTPPKKQIGHITQDGAEKKSCGGVLWGQILVCAWTFRLKL